MALSTTLADIAGPRDSSARSEYYQQPNDALLQLYRGTWPVKTADGNLAHDDATNAPKLTGYTADSRRYNSLLSLAAHEVQSATPEREIRFGVVLRPSFIRIHGTMYRK
eukprot:382443-Pyramimonas_sp.AAC.1